MDIETKNKIPVVIAQKMKYFSINLTQHVHNLCAENYKTLMKEINKDLNKWRDIMLMDLETQHRRISLISKLIYKFKAISIKIPQDFFCGLRQGFSKICMERQRD